jgi:hypothetical protein
MQRIEADYLARLRRSLRGVSEEVVVEIEREIQAHIEDALAARSHPGVGELLDVLDRLGPPETYARDLGLYMMVDRGYREWSLPYMIRSTAFWALSTVAGAVVVGIFGLLYLVAGIMAIAGTVGLLGQDASLRVAQMLGGPVGPGMVVDGYWPSPGLGSLLVGVVGLAGLTAVVRWFVGHYVRSARPHTAGGADADAGWVERTSRRILFTAVAGLGVTVGAGFASGVYQLGRVFEMSLPGDYLRSPLAGLSGIGMLVFLLAPVLGVLWTAVAEWNASRSESTDRSKGG